ncbi:MAG: hypothetical protein R2712_22815 [Vicinamibacterales bacterium]
MRLIPARINDDCQPVPLDGEAAPAPRGAAPDAGRRGWPSLTRLADARYDEDAHRAHATQRPVASLLPAPCLAAFRPAS